MSASGDEEQQGLFPQPGYPRAIMAEYQIVARKRFNGTYSFVARVVVIRPFFIRTFILGDTSDQDVQPFSPHAALRSASKLFEADQEVWDMLK